jgi:LacI family transcriptional regulator
VDVPGDLSVAGFDDIATLRDLVPALTTVRLPLTSLGEQALDLALGRSAAPSVRHVRGEVVLRMSTRHLTH